MSEIKSSRQLSIIIPAYNAESWLDPTTKKIDDAVRVAKCTAELIIINDGSKDDTLATARNLKLENIKNIRVLTHDNSGRFLTRKRGVDAAKYETILFIDTRVWIDANSLKYVFEQREAHPDRIVWNGDVSVAKKGNIIARFGDAVTCIGWRRYHGNPRLLSYDINDFDYYPKGTGLFMAPTRLIKEAISWFEKTTTDVKNSSDDTLMIRYIAERERIWISPSFTCTYFARTTIRAFISHTFYRGQFFVDGFMRKGTRFYYPLIAFLTACFVLCAVALFYPFVIPFYLMTFAVLWISELFVALVLRINVMDALSLFALSPIFAVVYGGGIWRAVIRRFLKI